MILVDNRVGSADLARYLGDLAQLTTLDYGDAAFYGRGKADNPVIISVERKTLGDLVSSMWSGRLSGHQVPGMLNRYDVVYLVVEGEWRVSPSDGFIEERYGHQWEKPKFTPSPIRGDQIWNYLNTLDMKCGVHVRQTRSMSETAALIKSLYGWWHEKAWDAHKSHNVLYNQEPTIAKMPLVYRVAGCIDSIGIERSAAVAQYFRSVYSLACASEAEWRDINGIGKKIAAKAWAELRSRSVTLE